MPTKRIFTDEEKEKMINLYKKSGKKAHDFSRGMNLPKSETFFEERDIYYKGEGVPLIGSGNETGGGSPPAQPCLEVTLHEPSENPMTSVVGVRQIDIPIRRHFFSTGTRNS